MIRWFPWGSELDRPEPGDRLWEIGTVDQVWDGEAWTRVCPRCDQPMHGRDAEGWLCCTFCGIRFDEVPRREVAPC